MKKTEKKETVDALFYRKYGMDDFDYAKKIQKEKSISWWEALQVIQKLYEEIFYDKYHENDFYEFKGDESDLPFVI